MSCELCELMKGKENFFVTECKTCHVPMVVAHIHSATVSGEFRDRALLALAQKADKWFGYGKWHYRESMRNIPSHWHVHADPGKVLGSQLSRRKVMKRIRAVKRIKTIKQESKEMGPKPKFNLERYLKLREKGYPQSAIALLMGMTPSGVSMAKRRLGIPSGNPMPKGSAHGCWEGGRYKSNGYIYVHQPDHPSANINGYIAEHRLVWEKAHCKKLRKGWVIHHINGVKDDNRPENLWAMPNGKHANIMPILLTRINELQNENSELHNRISQSHNQ